MTGRTVYIVTDGDTQTVHTHPISALSRYVLTEPCYRVLLPEYPGVLVPVTPGNVPALVGLLEIEGYLEFNNGAICINAAQLHEG